MMARLLTWLDGLPLAVVNGLALLLLALISILDYMTPPPISTSVFYMGPIAISAWFGSRRSGEILAVVSALAWAGKDAALRGVPYAEPAILFWNTSARLIMFVLVAFLIGEVRRYVRREVRLARTDPLTGLLNPRALRDELSLTLARASRSAGPVSFVYLDLDDFKRVNDERGHAEGDRVLGAVAETLRHELRLTDVIAREGGDEFAVILPSTDEREAATVVAKVHARLRHEMTRNGWPVTVSAGVVTCTAPDVEVEALIAAADRLMYEAKSAGKDSCRYQIMGPA